MYGKEIMEALEQRKRREALFATFLNFSEEDLNCLREWLRSHDIRVLEQQQMRNTYEAISSENFRRMQNAKYPA